MPEDLPTPSECANCGASIPRGAKACPECGADEKTGWREASVYDGLDLPDDAFDDGADRGSGSSPKRINGIAWYWWAVGMLLIVAVVLVFVVH